MRFSFVKAAVIAATTAIMLTASVLATIGMNRAGNNATAEIR